MKKRTGILITAVVSLIGYNFESYFLMGLGIFCLTLVLISKTKKHEIN
jgi:hypothetical protein